MTLKALRERVFKRTLVSFAVASCFAGVAFANPVGPSVVAGQASFAAAGSALTVTNSPNAIINWQGFSIGTGEITRFQQQSAASAVLNRVVGQDPSAILGTLSSNGSVYLINPNGILFGQGSRVDVAGLVASTLNITNNDFLAGRLNFEAGITAGSVINQGDIVTGSGGRVLLLAPDVQNHGLISSPSGEVVLAAGKSVQLVEADLPMLKVEVQSGGEALNVGQILADGGKIGVYAGLINQRGVVRADSASVDASGKIVFRSSDTTLLEAGSVTSAAGANGGEILVLGDKVGLTGDAKIDASGEAGGGTVLVGGDYQGKNADVQNAYRTYFGPEATIRADAITSGNGGKVIVWSDDATRAYGTISARGGAQAGDGGFVETSGHYLYVTRAPDVSAPIGRGGTWLLDPYDITISAASDQNSSNVGSGTTYDFRASASPSAVSVSTITAALAAGGNVTVRTTGSGAEQGNITVASPITTTQTTTASLTLRADNNIQATSDILLGSNVDLYLYATNSISTAALGGRYVYANATNGSVTTGTVTAGTSGVSMLGSGVVQPGAITAGSGVNLQSNNASVTVPNITTTGGSIYVYSFDDLTLASALSSPYYTQLQVQKPGGVLTMASGSSITTNTSGSGYSTQLRADDMVLDGTIAAGTNGYVSLDPYSYGRDIHIDTSPVTGALSLTPAELSTITTGTLNIGNNSSNYGNLTVSSALTSTDIKAANLQLYGRNITTGDLGVTGQLYLYSYGGDISTGALSAGNVDINSQYNSTGGITTGTITATSNLYLTAYGSVRPGAITTGGNVQLQSNYAGVTVPSITATGGSIYVYSYDDLTLASALSSPYYTQLQVQKPGGVLTMASGSSITTNTSSGGYTTQLRADDMVLGGTIAAGTNGYVSLDPYTYGRDINIGTVPATGALNLSPTEFATITTGTLNIGNYSSNYGNVTVTGALTSADINNVGNLSLYGRSITTGDLGVTGQLYLYSYGGDISTGTLSAGSVNINSYYNSTGGITTGTIAATGSVYLYGYGPVRPGAITAGSNVNLQSNNAGVTVPSITTTGGSIYVYSYDDLTLASALSSPYYTQLEVQRPGGVLTMASGSSISSSSTSGYSVSLNADEMVLGGSISISSNGYVYLNPQSYGRDINVGTGTAAGALNLTPAELSTISAGSLYVGNNYGSYYGGNLAVSSAIASTDIRASTLNLYGNNVSLGAGIAMNGNLGIYANGNIDANTTASTLDLSATGNIDLRANEGRIYRSGTGITNIIASTSDIYAPLGVDLGGDISSGDVSISWTTGDYQLNTLTATNLTLDVTNGGIVDTNGTALNITAGTLTLNAADGIGHGKALDTAIGTLTATSGGSNNIEISNTGNLTVTSVTNTGTGNIVLANAGNLTLGTASTTTGSFTASATGAIVAGANITAPAVQLTSGGSLSQSGGIISNGSLPATLTTTSVGGTVLNGNNLVSTFNATNTGGGNIEFRSTVPVLDITGINQSGGGVAIRANDLNLSGAINAGTGLISLAPLANTSDMFVGDVTGTGLQISTAEIQQIVSTNVEFGRSDGTGSLNIALPSTAIVAGSLRFLAGGSVNVSGGPYTLQGGAAYLPGTTNLLSGTSILVESGTLDASGGTVNLNGTLQATGGSVSAGTVNVGGTLNASSGSFSAGAVNVLSGGLLMGSGTVSADVTNSGTVAPGASPGLLTINGNYVQSPSGTLLVEIAGTTPGTQYDQLLVSGSVTLDGDLTTMLVGGYVPAPGDSFSFIMSSSAVTGSFANTTQPPSLQPPVAAVSPTTGMTAVTVSTAGTTAPPPVVVATQAEVATSTLPTQDSLQANLAEELELIQSLVVEPAGTTQEDDTLAKKPPACG